MEFCRRKTMETIFGLQVSCTNSALFFVGCQSGTVFFESFPVSFF